MATLLSLADVPAMFAVDRVERRARGFLPKPHASEAQGQPGELAD